LQTIQAQIRNGFSQPELSVKLIAAKLGVSPRYVRELLHKAGTTFTDRVKDLRLQKAHAMLTDRNCDHLMTSPMPAASARSRTSTAASVSGSVPKSYRQPQALSKRPRPKRGAISRSSIFCHFLAAFAGALATNAAELCDTLEACTFAW
jgi:AraC-like DNA-binding protein